MRFLRGLPLFYISYLVGRATGSHHDQHQQQVSMAESSCVDPPYKIHLFSSSPLVIYIEDFLTPEERQYLLNVTQDTFSDSIVADSSGAESLRSTRSSQSTRVPHSPTIRCIESRALSIQGFDTQRTQLEALQLVRYSRGGNYHWHTDWFTSTAQATAAQGGNRLSSFFAYVSAQDVTGGGTNFPLLDAPRDGRWCEFVDCDEEWERGTTFRPREGSAVFWRNLVEDEAEAGRWRGDERTLHAGLPVERGVKVGMNIWTREGELSEEFRGAE